MTQQLHAAGKTVIVVTHHLHSLSEYAERMLLLGQGLVLGEGSLREMYQQTELLRSTNVTPPQVALLTRHWLQRTGELLKALTPSELAAQLAYSLR